MTLTQRNLHQIAQRAAAADQSGISHVGHRYVDMAKVRAKRLCCRTCDGKGCVGRCRFEKVAA